MFTTVIFVFYQKLNAKQVKRRAKCKYNHRIGKLGYAGFAEFLVCVVIIVIIETTIQRYKYTI